MRSAASPHRNNFDLVRLFGALEVVVTHALHHFGLLAGLGDGTQRALGLFPGVPIFFVVSGFLITASFERSRSLAAYARNRALRIFPALWACFGLTLLLLLAAGELTPDFLRTTFVPWVIGQLTFVQVFNPDALRSFGVGVVNGSLWTIPVELGFYAMLPALLVLLQPWRRRAALLTAGMATVAVLSAALWLGVEHNATTPERLVNVTPLPHFWMFLLGAMAHVQRDRLMPFLQGRFPLWLAAYVVAGLYFLPLSGSPAAVLRFVLLAGVTLSAAHTAPGLAQRLLRGNDLSYGAYIYHMLVVNALLWGGFGGPAAVVTTLVATLVLAALSWQLVERPALARKQQRPVPRPLDAAAPSSPQLARTI